tara:strand:- start:3820 stop:4296 length:477 start_codon:yes stop_codon:yes gene_type:complete
MIFKENKIPHRFKVPENYFREAEELQENLKLISEIKSNFEVPNDYFKDSEKNLLQIPSKKSKIKVIQLIPFAAIIAACLLIFFSLNRSTPELNSDAALDRYFEEQQSLLTTFELFDLDLSESFEFETIAFENLEAETIFELQQAYDPNFCLIYEDYED